MPENNDRNGTRFQRMTAGKEEPGRLTAGTGLQQAPPSRGLFDYRIRLVATLIAHQARSWPELMFLVRRQLAGKGINGPEDAKLLIDTATAAYGAEHGAGQDAAAAASEARYYRLALQKEYDQRQATALLHPVEHALARQWEAERALEDQILQHQLAQLLGAEAAAHTDSFAVQAVLDEDSSAALPSANTREAIQEWRRRQAEKLSPRQRKDLAEAVRILQLLESHDPRRRFAIEERFLNQLQSVRNDIERELAASHSKDTRDYQVKEVYSISGPDDILYYADVRYMTLTIVDPDWSQNLANRFNPPVHTRWAPAKPVALFLLRLNWLHSQIRYDLPPPEKSRLEHILEDILTIVDLVLLLFPIAKVGVSIAARITARLTGMVEAAAARALGALRVSSLVLRLEGPPALEAAAGLAERTVLRRGVLKSAAGLADRTAGTPELRMLSKLGRAVDDTGPLTARAIGQPERGLAPRPSQLRGPLTVERGITGPSRLLPGTRPGPRVTGGARGQTANTGGIASVDRTVDPTTGAAQTTIQGRLLPTLTRRFGLEKWLRAVRGFDRAHLWGRIFGDEAAAGVSYAPPGFNGGVQLTLEKTLQGLEVDARASGGQVWAKAVGRTYGRDVMGGHALAELRYEFTIRLPNGQVGRTVRIDFTIARPGTPVTPRSPGWTVAAPLEGPSPL